MSTLRMVERAALSLPGEEQRYLLAVLSAALQKSPAPPEVTVPAPGGNELAGLHPELQPMVGIMPAHVDAHDVHEYRLLKHA